MGLYIENSEIFQAFIMVMVVQMQYEVLRFYEMLLRNNAIRI